ncbi:MAG: leucyl aminopeptidase [Proteobacteria bacterium]|nr:leucyl aminopeptidase [Pseudomonadota bacterium]
MKIIFAAPKLPGRGAVAVGVMAGAKLSPSAANLDKATGGALGRAIKGSRFTGKKGQLLEVLGPPGVGVSRILLAGLGKPGELEDVDLENLGGSVMAQLQASGAREVAIMVDAIGQFRRKAPQRAARYGFGALLRSYRFDKYRTKEKPEDKPSLAKVTVMVQNPAAARRAFDDLEKIAEGVFFTRDLVSEPANIIYPKSLAREARKLGKLGVKVQVLGTAEMRRLGMGALLGVAQGSDNDPQLVVMRWDGAPKGRGAKGRGAKGRARGPIAFVGKGVTFDTGGISIKPSAHMEDMKWDMGGAGVVIGLMRALAGRKARVNAVGVCGLVENMPSAKAQRPGDIVTSASGQTIEVINTDAEGRLVLADALWYVQEKFKPRAIIDLATLTGAIIVALGHDHAGLFSNDDRLAERLTAAGKAVGEPVWRMPLGESYDKNIDSDAADMKNVGARGGGAITAAQFLQRFVDKGMPWAHLDIAGVTWESKAKPTAPKGGTGFGVRLLDRLVADHYEG